MAEIIYMPKLSDTMTEGVVAEWHKKVGDAVKNGELLAEIETDKATMEFESFYDGVLLHIGVEKGKPVPVNSLLAIIGEKGEDIKAVLAEGAKGADGKGGEAPKEEKAPEKKENKEEKAETEPEPADQKGEGKPAEAAKPEPAKQAQSTQSHATGGRILASPLAKKLAEEKGVDLGFITGTGDGGRITKRDVDHYVPYDAPERPAGQSGGTSMSESYKDEPVSQMRKTIARRLLESTTSSPVFFLNIEVDMDNAIATRTAMNSIPDTKISFNDLVIKASAAALRKHPRVNTSWLGDKIRAYDHINIGMAVAVEDGLIVPVIRFADQKSLSQISAEAKDLGKRAKDRKLQPADWEGNTFTVSNLGMFGIESFTSIINMPESCILSVGAIRQVPVVKNNMVVPGNTMMLTLACDHRTVDGATGAAFLQTLKTFIETPAAMLV